MNITMKITMKMSSRLNPGLEKGTLSGLPALGLDGESIPGRWIMLDRAPGTPGTPGVPVHVGDQGGVIDLVTNLWHHWISLAHDVPRHGLWMVVSA